MGRAPEDEAASQETGQAKRVHRQRVAGGGLMNAASSRPSSYSYCALLLLCGIGCSSAEADASDSSASGGGGHVSGGTSHSAGAGSGGERAMSTGGTTPSVGGTSSTGGSDPAGGQGGLGGSGATGGATAEACPGPHFATEVADLTFPQPRNGSDAFGRDLLPGIVLGPPGGSTDVVSLGNGGSITLSFGDVRIVDGPGIDFIVFENPMVSYKELGTVDVSEDGVVWYTYPCNAPQTRTDPVDTDYGLCAGWHLVGANGSDWKDPAQAGGDQYDLADFGVSGLRVRYVRITDRADLVKTAGDVTSPTADSFDLDAIGVIHADCPE